MNRNFLSRQIPSIFSLRRITVIGVAMWALGCGHNAPPHVAPSSLNIVEESQPHAVIVTGPAPGEHIKSAAKELQAYIERSTGARLPIASEANAGTVSIHVGETPYVKSKNLKPADLDSDGFILCGYEDGNYVIVGGSDLGVTFGVYEFLERYVGVRWLFPGEEGEDVPAKKDLAIPLDQVRQEPWFLSRDFYIANRPHESEVQWSRRNRLHNRAQVNHAMNRLLPASEFGNTNPEFYPLINGKRMIPWPVDGVVNYRWQPNFGAPGIAEAVAGKLNRYFKENPEATSESLGLNDGQDNFGEAPETLRFLGEKKNSGGYVDASDYYFLFANSVVEKVVKEHPRKWFGTLAYRSIYDPPSYAGVHDQIVVYLTYDRLFWADPKLRKFDQDRTEAWLKVAKHTAWYDYHYGAAYFVPRVYPHLIGEYLSWAADRGIRFHYGELIPNWGEGPKPWLLTKLFWNPRQDVDALLDEWYERVAGKDAAPKLREYYEIWEEFCTKEIPKTSWWSGRIAYLPFYNKGYLQEVSQDKIKRSDRLLSDALALASTPAQKVRVRKLAEMWETWYKPNVLLYQMQRKIGQAPSKEAEALKRLDEAGAIMVMARRFQDTLAAWKTDKNYTSDPFFYRISERLRSGRLRLGNYGDGSVLLWQLEPWVTKSTEVHQQLQKMAQADDPIVRNNVRALLASALGQGTQLMKNASFEEGVQSWDLQVDTKPFPSDYPFPVSNQGGEGTFAVRNINTRSGSHSLEVSADRIPGTINVKSPARIAQTISYEPGLYYVTVNHYLPPGSKRMSPGDLTVQVLDEHGNILPETVMSPVAIDAVPGRKGRGIGVFALSPNPNAKRLRIVLSLSMLTVNNDFDPNLKIYIDDFDVVKVD